MRKQWPARIIQVVMFGLVSSMLVTMGCQSEFIYFPRKIDPSLEARLAATKSRRLTYVTGEGRQTAYYVPPRESSGGMPDALWIITAGNASLASDWLEDTQKWSPRHGWLLVDYPGYGECEGDPNPDTIRANYIAAFALLAVALDTTPPELKPRSGSVGHSLGAAVALDGASALGLKRVVVLAPFTCMEDMARLLVGPLVSWILTHKYDNRAQLDRLVAAGCQVVIYHGSADEIIPVEQGRDLALRHPSRVDFHEIRGGRHGDLIELAGSDIGESLSKLSAP